MDRNNTHSHSVSVTVNTTGSTHSHSVTGSINDVGESGVNKNLPPYLALNFIIKVAR